MTIHRQSRVRQYGWYYAGFAMAALGVIAVVLMLVSGAGSVELTPWRPFAYLLAVAIVGGAIRLRARGR